MLPSIQIFTVSLIKSTRMRYTVNEIEIELAEVGATSKSIIRPEQVEEVLPLSFEKSDSLENITFNYRFESRGAGKFSHLEIPKNRSVGIMRADVARRKIDAGGHRPWSAPSASGVIRVDDRCA